MDTVSSTDFNRRPARALRRAGKQAIGIEFRGRTRCMVVPVDYQGMDPLERLTIDDVPKESRYQRSDIMSWLISEHACRLLRDLPTQTMVAMRSTFDRHFRSDRMDSRVVERWKHLLDAGPEAIITALHGSGDRVHQLRQTGPFDDLLGVAERDRLFRTAIRLSRSKQPQAA